MPCIVIKVPGAVFSVWGKPENADVVRVLEELKTASQEAGKPVLYVTRVPVDAPAPEPDVRKHLNGLMPTIVKYCSSYHVVLEGEGFMAAVKRGVLTSLLQPLWRKRVFHVHATANGVLGSLPADERDLATRLLKVAGEKGCLACSAPQVAERAFGTAAPKATGSAAFSGPG
jgi:hypothetical protein